MKSSKRIAFFLALAQTTPVAPALYDSSVLFIDAKTIWLNSFEQLKAIANVLNRAVFNVSGGKTSLERIKQDTSVVGTLPTGSPQMVLDLSKQFVSGILETVSYTHLTLPTILRV